MSTLDAALSLAAKGCPVFPLDPGTKTPVIKRWPDLATTDAATIRKWWSRRPEANVGVHTRGLLVLDIDGPEGHDHLGRLADRFGLPATLRVESGNTAEPHHYQLLYRLPPGLRSWNKPLARFKGFEEYRKIDVRTDRGQVVGPGSVHATGGVYRWAAEPSSVPAEATPAPAWMLAALCRPSATEANGRADVGSDAELLTAVLNRFPLTGPGQRNQQTTAVVGYLAGKGFEQERVLRVATGWVRSFEGVYRTPVETAEEEARSLVYRTFQNLLRGSFELMPDHQRMRAELKLPPAAADWLSRLCCTAALRSGASTIPCPSTPHVSCSRYRRLSQTEADFVTCLLVHCQYELAGKELSEPVLATDRQWLVLYQDRFGRKLAWDTFYSLKKKFVTRRTEGGTVQPASLRELLVLEQKGTFGRASVYRLTGLLAALLGGPKPTASVCAE